MTRRERVIRALQHQTTDIIPYQADFNEAEHQKIAAYLNDPHFQKKYAFHMAGGNYWGDPKEMPDQIELYRDDFGIVWNRSCVDKDIGVIDTLIIEDIDSHDYAFPPVPEQTIRTACKNIIDNKEDKFSYFGIGFSMFERSWTLCGMENVLMAMVVSPAELDDLYERITQFNLSIMDIVLEYELDGFYFGDDWGQQKGMIMGPGHWRRFIKPMMKKLYDKAKTRNRFVLQHSCGDIHDIFPDLIEIGLDAYQTFQPEIYDIVKVKQEFGHDLSFWGGISTQTLLPFETPENIKNETKRIMDIMGADGGFIAAPTHSVPADVPVENILAMLSAFENQ